MKTDNLYIASLRVVIKRIYVNPFKEKRTHRHIKYVLVKSDDMQIFIDVKTHERYTDCLRYYDKGISLKYCYHFNEITGNTKKNLSKRKALTLFNNTVEGWRSK